MPPSVFVNAKLWLDAFDLTGDLNAITIDAGGNPQDASVLGSDTRRFLSGAKQARLSAAGLWQAGTNKLDEILFGRIGVQHTIVTVAGEAGAEGNIARFLRVTQGQYRPGASYGEILRFDVTAEASDTLVRGTVLHNATRTGSGSGTAFQLGQVAAGQRLYAALHFLAISGGPTVTVRIESDDAVGFPSPTTRFTFTARTTIGQQWATPVAGPITDDWWRVAWTFAGGASPSATFVVPVGIQ